MGMWVCVCGGWAEGHGLYTSRPSLLPPFVFLWVCTDLLPSAVQLFLLDQVSQNPSQPTSSTKLPIAYVLCVYFKYVQ